MSVISNGDCEAIKNATDEVLNSPFSVQASPNPMLTSVVLQTLFEYASIEEMKTYRQVCKLWWEESLPRWRRNVWVNLTENKRHWSLSMDSYLDGMNGNASSDPYLFGKHPYKRFMLYKLDEMSDQQLEFWRRCGPKMTHLQVACSTFRSVDEAILFRFVPKLVSLEFIMMNWLDEEVTPIDLMEAPCESTINSLEELTLVQCCGKLLPVTWLHFLAQFPRIKTLSVTNRAIGLDWLPGRELANILDAMITLAREQGICWKLEKLDLLFMGKPEPVVLESRHSELVRQLHLPLTTLCLHIDAETPRSALRSILETCALRLRKLVVYRDDDFTSDDVGEEDFPYGVQLDTLSELWLSGRLLCDNLNFLHFTPNLTSLILAQDIGNSLLAAGSNVSGHRTWSQISKMLSQYEIDGDGHSRETGLSLIQGTDFTRLEHVVITGLKEFIVSGRQESACCADEVAALSKLMPNLKTLMLGLGNDGFRVVCEGWRKQLEVLVVQPYEVNQFGLTGNVPLLGHRLPNLSDITGLRYFGMGFDTGGLAKTNLTEEAVLNTIFPLKNLEGIAAVYDKNKMGVEVRDKLLSKFPKSKIHGNEDDVQEWQVAAEGNSNDH